MFKMTHQSHVKRDPACQHHEMLTYTRLCQWLVMTQI
jgi:hypothetical protein